MEFKKPIEIQCPYCQGSFTSDREFIQKNGRVMCNNCCKAFDLELPKEGERYQEWDKRNDDFGYWNGY